MEKDIIYSGFIMGYICVDNINKWADNKILEGNNEYRLIELSMANDKNTILDLLYSLKKELETDKYYFSLYNKLLKAKLCDWKFILSEMIKFNNNHFAKENISEDFFVRMNNFYSLTKDNLPGNMKMPDELSLFLNSYNLNIDIFKKLGFKVDGIEISRAL